MNMEHPRFVFFFCLFSRLLYTVKDIVLDFFMYFWWNVFWNRDDWWCMFSCFGEWGDCFFDEWDWIFMKIWNWKRVKDWICWWKIWICRGYKRWSWNAFWKNISKRRKMFSRGPMYFREHTMLRDFWRSFWMDLVMYMNISRF